MKYKDLIFKRNFGTITVRVYEEKYLIKLNYEKPVAFPNKTLFYDAHISPAPAINVIFINNQDSVFPHFDINIKEIHKIIQMQLKLKQKNAATI